MRSRSQTGFNLVEVILIVIVVAVAIPPIFRLVADVLVQSGESKIYLKQLQYAQEKMETIIADRRSSQRGFTYITQANSYPQDFPEPAFTRTVAVDALGNQYDYLPYAQISVTVSHTDNNDITLTMWMIDR
jgi:Tfp pilus assembly protein PilV